MAEKLFGVDYVTPDLVPKITGRARYAEDFRADGMLFAKLLLSPMPHGRVRSIDYREAMAMPGVEAILTADDPEVTKGDAPNDEAGLTNEPLYEGEPILAVAAVDETTAADAIEKIRVDLEPLPFAVDPLVSLRPNGPNARLEGNTVRRIDRTREFATVKWTDEDFAELAQGRLPEGETTQGWEYGDIDAGFADAELILDETIFHQSLSHQPLETRSAMAYWQNGKLYLHGSTQSTARTVAPIARWCGIEPENVVLIAKYCGGAFGGKVSGAVSMRIPALLSKKTGKPVMMRITRQEEHFIGRGRAGLQGRVKIGFRQDGRLTAVDLFLVQDGGPYGSSGDMSTAASVTSLTFQPIAMRFRGISIFTNTPPRGIQRAPGGEQAIAMFSPLMNKAAHRLGLDPAEILRVNAPSGQAEMGAPRDNGLRRRVSSAFAREAIDKGVEIFNWRERLQRAGQRRGPKATGLGIALSGFMAGSSGLDGLMVIRPDGRLTIHQGIGNLGTESFSDTARIAAETLGLPWDRVEIIWGDTSKSLPWSTSQAGSATTTGHTRSNLAAAEDAKRKLQEIAARDLGGSPSDYDIDNGRVFRRGNSLQGMSFARAAERAIELGGKFDGHELPEDLNGMTTRSATALAGQGLMGVAKDNYPTNGSTYSFVVGLAEVEVDVETGHVRIVDYAATTDCGAVMHPRSLGGQLHGGGIQGFGIALGQKWVYDQNWGLTVARRFYSNKPPTILDVPTEEEMKWAAVEIPDPYTPVGAKGIGEPPIGAGVGAVLAAIANALGEQYLNRSPVTADMILNLLESLPSGHTPMAAHV